MECRLCGYPKTHKHGKMQERTSTLLLSGVQTNIQGRVLTRFTTGDESVQSKFNIQQVLQAHSEGSSLRGVSRITGLAYNTVISIIRSASGKAQLVHNQQV